MSVIKTAFNEQVFAIAQRAQRHAPKPQPAAMCTTIPAGHAIPEGMSIKRAMGTAINPFSGFAERVEIVSLRSVRDTSPQAFILADVQRPGALLGYSVRIEELKNVQAFVSREH